MIAALFMSSISLWAQNKQVALVRTTECEQEEMSFIVIINPDNKENIIPLQKLDVKKGSQVSNTKAIRAVLQDFYDKGFDMEASQAGGRTTCHMATYILVKEE